MVIRFLFLAFVLVFVTIVGCQSVGVAMSDGERLYRAKCSSCHNIIAASEYDKLTWEKYTDKYGKKLKREEKELMLGYLAGGGN
ncbi:MAG: cytochrome c [Planctomycetes bacterium]|nr:cytochrome c [Planctomycetota bacterium]